MATTLETPRTDLLESLSKHNESFTTLLSLIPAQYYIQPTQEEADSKWMKNKKRKTGEELKEHKRISKASKLDPENNKTTVDILFPSDGPSAPAPAASGDDQPHPGFARPLPPAANISTLRTKLANKLAAFKSHRQPYPNEPDQSRSATGSNGVMVGVRGGAKGGVVKGAAEGGEGGDAGPSSRDALEEESRRRRGEVRDNRRRERKEQRRKEEGSGGRKGEEGKGKGKPVPKEERSVPTAKTQLLVPDRPTHTDSLSYPALALPSGSKSTSTTDRPTSTFKPLSNPAQALAQLQKHNRHMDGMDDARRAEAVESEKWAKALHRAEGGKVADDEKVLKKAVKRLEKTKGKSGKEWADRKRDIQNTQSIAIKKRNDNIASKLQARKDKKMGVKKKDAPKGSAGSKKGNGKGYQGKNRDPDGGGAGAGLGITGNKSKGGAGGGKKGRPGFEGKGKK